MSGFLSFCGWIIFHMYITHFLYPVTYRWRLGLPPYQEFLNLYEKDERFSEGRSIFSWPLQFQLPLSSQLLLLLLPKIIPLRIWPRVWLKIGGKNIYRVSSLGALCTLPHNVALSCPALCTYLSDGLHSQTQAIIAFQANEPCASGRRGGHTWQHLRDSGKAYAQGDVWASILRIRQVRRMKKTCWEWTGGEGHQR